MTLIKLAITIPVLILLFIFAYQIGSSLLEGRNVEDYVYLPLNNLYDKTDFEAPELDAYRVNEVVYVPVIQYDRQNRNLRDVRVNVFRVNSNVNMHSFHVKSDALGIDKHVNIEDIPYRPLWSRRRDEDLAFASIEVSSGLKSEKFTDLARQTIGIQLTIKITHSNHRDINYELTKKTTF